MLIAIPANPVPTELYAAYKSGSFGGWLPWLIWGGGVYATKYGYPSTSPGYFGTVSVPLAGSAVVRSLRMLGAVQEGAKVSAALYVRQNNYSWPLANIVVDRLSTAPPSPYVDVTQSAGDFAASAALHHLAIQLVGSGQGIATVYGFVVDLAY